MGDSTKCEGQSEQDGESLVILWYVRDLSGCWYLAACEALKRRKSLCIDNDTKGVTGC